MPGKTILIVDDENDILNLLQKKLTEKGFQVISATRGREGIDKIKSQRPDLILMDIVLPDIGGPEVIKAIKEDPATRHIPVIFLSGIVSRQDDDTDMGVHVDGIRYNALAKPFYFQELYEQVQKVLSP